MKLGKFHICTIILVLIILGCQKTGGEHKRGEEFTATESGLQYQILQEGSGPGAQPGDEVLIFETTSYLNGTVLYSNENSGNPIKIRIGANQVTAGVDEGLRGMKEGEIRQLLVPHYLAIRQVYPDHISPDSGLVIKIILDKIIKKLPNGLDAGQD